MSTSRLAFLLLSLVCAHVLRAASVSYGVLTPTGDGFPSADALDAVKASGAQYVAMRADWPRLQPTPSTWCFARLDAAVEAAEARSLTVVLTLGPAPRWTVRYLPSPTDEEVARARPDIAAWRGYAAALARRYQGRIRYYRLWEPPTATVLLAMPCDIYALYRAAASAIHGVNPALRVIAPEPGGVNLEWIASYLSGSNGAEAPDIMALTPSRTASTTGEFRWRCQVLRDRVLPKTGAPTLWAELPANDDGRLADAARRDGIAMVWYPAGDEGCFQRIAPELPQPSLPWPVPVKANMVSLDFSGRNAMAIRPLPDMPGGHYTQTVIDGCPALVTARDANPWLHFDVPDGFLFYNRERVPVEVTVRVLGALHPQKTGFSLYYDAIGGMNNSAWQWISVGPDQEFAYTFRLNDALFSDRDGYDIRLCIGGSEEDVRVVGLTVRKLGRTSRRELVANPPV